LNGGYRVLRDPDKPGPGAAGKPLCGFHPMEVALHSARLSSQNLTHMAYKIDADNCVACGACVDGCPVGAISEKDSVYTIDAEKCTDCGACESTCPNGAIAAG